LPVSGCRFIKKGGETGNGQLATGNNAFCGQHPSPRATAKDIFKVKVGKQVHETAAVLPCRCTKARTFLSDGTAARGWHHDRGFLKVDFSDNLFKNLA
jgi:hypothetical protein